VSWNPPEYVDLDEVIEVAEEMGYLPDKSGQEHIDALHRNRERVGTETRIHALAPGTDIEMLRELRAHPDLIDSLDVSTPEQAPANNKIPDATWQQPQRLLPFGKDISTVRGAYSSAIALQLCHMLSPLCNEKTFEKAIARRDDDHSAKEQAQDDGIKTIDQWASG